MSNNFTGEKLGEIMKALPPAANAGEIMALCLTIMDTYGCSVDDQLSIIADMAQGVGRLKKEGHYSMTEMLDDRDKAKEAAAGFMAGILKRAKG